MAVRSTLILSLACALVATGAVAAPQKARARPAPSAAEADAYVHDAITVTANGREGVIPTDNCLVWANAEGLGVGPEQLNGFHGLNMNINPKPLPGESGKPTTFADGFALLKGQNPNAPAWLLAALEKNGPAIETACASPHATPMTIVKLTARDKRG